MTRTGDAMPIIQPRLTPRETEVLDFYVEFWLEHQEPAKPIDVAEHFGFSEQIATRHLNEIVRKNYLVVRYKLRRGRMHRALVPLRPLIFVRPAEEGIIIATIGGPKRYTIPEWREFLISHLDDLDHAEDLGRRDQSVELRLVHAEPDNDQAEREQKTA